MPFALPPLPYPNDGLAPVMSAETLTFHHGRHHRAYVDTANALLAQRPERAGRLSDVIRGAREAGDEKLFNASAQIWNHSFFWQCLAPAEGRRPEGRLKALIEEGYGSAEAMVERLQEEAVDHFSNGWAWLVLDRGRLDIVSLHDADTPVAREGMAPLLTLDVWEHAYYIDYRNDRAEFVEAILSRLVNWEFVSLNLDGGGIGRADQDWA